MMIKKKRIRSLDLHLGFIKNGQDFYVGVSGKIDASLKKIGLDANAAHGSTILPTSIGPVTRFNAEGRQLKLKDLPKETAYRIVEWHWTEWHGKSKVEKSDFREIRYSRFQRSFVPPPSVELTLLSNTDGDLVLVSPMLKKTNANESQILHTINVFLEIFGECEIYNEDMSRIIKAPIKRLNWKILPPGELPWKKMASHLTPLITKARKGNQPVIINRLETINLYGPDFAAIGHGGFNGYVIFGFKKKGIYTLESIYYGNATYVLGDAWAKISQKSKAEILDNKLHKERIIHRNTWHNSINKLLS